MAYSEGDQGKCLTCGFLSKYAQRTQRYYEVSISDRETGGVPLSQVIPPDGFIGRTPAQVRCFRHAIDLEDKIRTDAAQTGGDPVVVALKVLTAQQNCPQWFRYYPGLSPRDHLTNFMWEQLEARRQQYEVDRERDRRVFEERLSDRAEALQLKLAERDEQLQTQRDREQGRNTRLITRITLVGILIAFAQVLTLTKDPLLWKLVAAIYHLLGGH